MKAQGWNQPNPECGKFYMTNNSPVSLRNKWHEESGKEVKENYQEIKKNWNQ